MLRESFGKTRRVLRRYGMLRAERGGREGGEQSKRQKTKEASQAARK